MKAQKLKLDVMEKSFAKWISA